jgi:hypothetical protein
MERNGRPRRRLEALRAPTTLHEITRRYYACAVALAKAMGVPMSETFLQAHRESISCCFIEAGKAGVRLPSAVQLPPLEPAGHPAPEPEPDRDPLPPGEGEVPPPLLTAASLPTRVPAGLPCAGQAIDGLKPAQLHMLCGKTGLRAMADPSLQPLHVALLAERARRFAQGQRAEANHAP